METMAQGCQTSKTAGVWGHAAREIYGCMCLCLRQVFSQSNLQGGLDKVHASLHGEVSSECIESAKQPSPTEKRSRITLYILHKK